MGYFSIQAPEAWLEGELDESQGEVFYALDPEKGSDILIIAEDVLSLGAGELSLTEYADLIESSVLTSAGGREHYQGKQCEQYKDFRLSGSKCRFSLSG